MKFQIKDPPREFKVGSQNEITLKDCAHIELANDEQITLLTETGKQLDATRKSWGFYPVPSINSRLDRFAMRAVLTKNSKGQYFILVVEKEKEDEFIKYTEDEQMQIVTWLDEMSLKKIESLFLGSSN